MFPWFKKFFGKKAEVLPIFPDLSGTEFSVLAELRARAENGICTFTYQALGAEIEMKAPQLCLAVKSLVSKGYLLHVQKGSRARPSKYSLLPKAYPYMEAA